MTIQAIGLCRVCAWSSNKPLISGTEGLGNKVVGLPVNVTDDLAHSTFIFPAIVDRGDVVVAVGTGGSSPVVARRVREQIEAALPARIGDLANLIGRWRKKIHSRIPEFALRQGFPFCG